MTHDITFVTEQSETRLTVCPRHQKVLFALPTTMSLAVRSETLDPCVYCAADVPASSYLSAQTTLAERLAGLIA